MDKVQFSQSTTTADHSDDDDYSASVTAIMQRRASTRKSKRRNSRRTSSPFSPDILPGSDNGRRRSSVYTTSSGDTAITMDDPLPPSQEQIYENIRLHKEVLANVRMQAWNMRKKLRLVNQAKNYIKRHQGALQERLAQSRSTKDILTRWNLIFVQKLQYVKREMANLSTWCIPWELRIKEIESHFGSVVASYFIFLRWLFWVNLVISAVLVAFVTVPELLTADPNKAGDRKVVLKEDKYNATNLLTLWDFEGVLKYSPLFYGWYTDRDDINKGYRLPFAYFMTGLAVYTYSFVATLRKMAENSRLSKLSEKGDECVFSWKLFTGWDYMIGNPETAHNRVASIVMSFKEALLEEAEKRKERRNWKIIAIRVFVNLMVIGLLILSAYAVIEVVRRSAEPEAKSTLWRANEVTVVMTLISMVFPMVFEVLGFAEQYHPRKQLRIQLGRIMVLNLLNLYSLIFALFDKINNMSIELQTFKRMGTPIPEDVLSSTTSTYVTSQLYSTAGNDYNATFCYEICATATTIPSLINNLTSTTFDEFYETFLPSNLTTSLPDDLINATDYYYDNGTRFGANFTEALMNYFSNLTSRNNTDSLADDDDDDDEVSYEFLFWRMFAKFLSGEPQNNDNALSENATTNYTSLDVQELKINASNLLNKMVAAGRKSFNNSLDLLSIARARGEETNSQSNEDCQLICERMPTDEPKSTFAGDVTTATGLVTVAEEKSMLNYTSRSRLRSLCWETMFGQELVKLTVMDLVMTVASTLGMDFCRGLFVRYFNRCWCWDLEKRFPQYGDFKVAENILHLVNNQGMVWMGLFFSPGLAVINAVKLYIIMYFRSWTVLTCNVPHEVIFRASRSNNFYFALLLLMLFLCVLPVGYAIVWIPPSWHCGPFSNYLRIFKIFTRMLKKVTPKRFEKALDYIASPGTIIPLLVLLILIIYYLVSLTNALREANNDLKVQLRRERTEERRKMFQIADRRRRVGSEGSSEAQTPFSKWKKLLQTLPDGKSLDETPRDSEPMDQKEAKIDSDKKAFLSKFIRRAIRKSSTVDDEDANTDTEQNESLPDDANARCGEEKTTEATVSVRPKSSSFRHAINATMSQKRGNGNRTDAGEVKHVKINDIAVPHVIKREADSCSSGQITVKSVIENDGKRTNINTKETDVLSKNASDDAVAGKSSEVLLKDVDVIRNVMDHESKKKRDGAKELAKREDSLASNWSDNIPVITISKTESEECILDSGKSKNGEETAANISAIDNGDAVADDDDITGDEDVKSVVSAKRKNVLMKQTPQIESDDVADEEDFRGEPSRGANNSNGSNSVQTSSETTTTAATKTESSGEYKDDCKFT